MSAYSTILIVDRKVNEMKKVYAVGRNFGGGIVALFETKAKAKAYVASQGNWSVEYYISKMEVR